MHTFTRRSVFTALSATALIGLLAAATGFGPLNPPAGAVTGTAKPLGEVEPRIAINATNTPGDVTSLFKITQPGSYYLTGNITGALGKWGIFIAASGVTLDLNGFDLVGVAGMGAFDGIYASAGSSNITIRNGSVRNWGGSGIDLYANSAPNSIIVDVVASGNAQTGIGVLVAGTLARCSSSNNGEHGFLLGSGCTVHGCSAFSNSLQGFRTGFADTLAGCTSQGNSGGGYSVTVGCTITGCTAYGNTGNGIATLNGCTVTGCTAYANTGSGILAGTGSTVSGCTATSNTLDGIQTSSGCSVLANTCYSNGLSAGDGAGIHATGSDNRIEGNNCANADRGIDVDSAGNVIIKNTCSGNTINWVIATNNAYGPIIDRTALAGASVSGNAAASTLGSTDPSANYSY